MEKEKSILETALHYLTKGYSVIPIKRNKRPFIPWIQYQQKKPTEDEIRGWWDKWPSANVGIVTGKISGIVVIDVDEAQGFDAIQQYIPDSLVIPTTQTPRGGQHFYFQAPEEALGNNSRLIPGCDFRGDGGYAIAPPSTNGKGKNYAWLDGLSIEEAEPPPLPDAYVSFITKALSLKGCIRKDDFQRLPGDFQRLPLTSTDFQKIPEGIRDETLFHIANGIINGSMSIEETEQLLGLMAFHCCNPPFPLKEIPAKIQSVLNRIERRKRNVAQEVREWVLTSSGFFMTSDLHNGLPLTSRQDKKAAVLELLKMEKRGLIERHGGRNGCYRRVESEAEDIDYLNAPTEPINLKLPFEIEEKVELMPGNIITIAGEVNAGKTAFLLNVVLMNMERFNVYYFSSEMGKSELKKRLSKFNHPLDAWRWKPKERCENFADVIVPGEGNLNIIDFLEIHDQFYLIGQELSHIHDKLKGAVAIVAIQKNPGTDWGIGGRFSMEKPRLYLSMGKGKLKIVKAKNWATQNNPNGLEVKFKIVDGCKLIREGSWYLAKPHG